MQLNKSGRKMRRDDDLRERRRGGQHVVRGDIGKVVTVHIEREERGRRGRSERNMRRREKGNKGTGAGAEDRSRSRGRETGLIHQAKPPPCGVTETGVAGSIWTSIPLSPPGVGVVRWEGEIDKLASKRASLTS
jgi:hypothetical protein